MAIRLQELQLDTLDFLTGKLFSPNGMEITRNKTSTQAIAPAKADPLTTFKTEIQGLMSQKKPPKIEQVKKAIIAHQEIPEEHKQSLMDYALSLAPDPLKQLMGKDMLPNYKPAGIDPKVQQEVDKFIGNLSPAAIQALGLTSKAVGGGISVLRGETEGKRKDESLLSALDRQPYYGDVVDKSTGIPLLGTALGFAGEVAIPGQGGEESAIERKLAGKFAKKEALSSVDTLAAEARKFQAEGKTLEEFVKAQEANKVYHGTTENFDTFKLQGGKNLGPDAIFVSSQKGVADYYAQGIGKTGTSQVKEGYITGGKIFDYKNPKDVENLWSSLSKKTKDEIMGFETTDYVSMDKIKSDIVKGRYDILEKPAVQDAIKKLGYDGFHIRDYTGGDATGIFNPDILQTKSQLTELWNKENGKAGMRGEGMIKTIAGVGTGLAAVTALIGGTISFKNYLDSNFEKKQKEKFIKDLSDLKPPKAKVKTISEDQRKINESKAFMKKYGLEGISFDDLMEIREEMIKEGYGYKLPSLKK